MRGTVQPADRQFLKRQKGVKAKIAALAFTLDKPLLSLLQCHISVFPRACCRVELWFFTLLHTGLFVLKLYGYTPLLASITNERAPVNEWAITLEVSIVSISSTFMALLLVFYNSQCYGRFTSFYHASCGMGGALQEIAEITSVTMAGSPAQHPGASSGAVARERIGTHQQPANPLANAGPANPVWLARGKDRQWADPVERWLGRLLRCASTHDAVNAKPCPQKPCSHWR
jgi:hypothetical protein